MKRRFNILLLVIVILAAMLRLRGFDNHFLLASDSGRDLLVARGAVIAQELPWVGSFSSAGPFVFGPNWYWFLMLPTILFPQVFFAPWILMFLVSLFFVFVMGLVGRVVGGQRFGLVVALVTAISPLAISQSAYLTQHAGVEIFAALAMLGFIVYVKTKKLLFAFLMASAIGGAAALHYQGIYLGIYFPLLILPVIREPKKWLKLGLVCAVGVSIFLLPLLLWDASRGFRNLIELWYFYRVGQYRFYVPNRWLTYLVVFWPGVLGQVIGGTNVVGGLWGSFGLVVIAIGVVRKLLPKVLLLLLGAFFIQVVLLRYYRGERFEGYLIYLHPILILLSAWVFYQLIRWKRLVGYVALFILMILSIRQNMVLLDWKNDYGKLVEVSKELKEKFPGEKFSIYARNLATSNCTYSLSLVLESIGLGSDSGRPIGVCGYTIDGCSTPGAVRAAEMRFQNDSCVIADLEKADKKSLIRRNDWYPMSVLAVFDDVQHWWKR